MNERSMTTTSNSVRGSSAVAMCRALIFSRLVTRGSALELGMKLSSPDIDANDVACASLQCAVREAACRGADVQDVSAGKIESELLDRAGQFLSSARDETRRLLDREFDIARELFARFVQPFSSAQNPSGHDQCFGLRARLREPARDQKLIKT